MTDASGNGPRSPNELAETRTDLALQRTLMAADRSLTMSVTSLLLFIAIISKVL